MVTEFSGQPYQLGGRELMASNSLVHAEMQSVAAETARTAPDAPLSGVSG
jgi:hypothetical protein